MLSKVMIIGAGTGGLCRAQGLKNSGIGVSVFERDRTPTDRLQGYRLHISSNGAHALKQCLPADLFNDFLNSAAIRNSAANFLDSDLKRLLTLVCNESALTADDRSTTCSPEKGNHAASIGLWRSTQAH